MIIRKSRLKHQIEYIALRSVVLCINIFPVQCILFFSTALGYFAWLCFPFRLRVAYRNISNVFPEKGHREKLFLLKKSYLNICQTFGLVFILHRPALRRRIEHAEITGLDKIEHALKQNRGIILTTCHACWFEAYFAWFNCSTLPVSLIYRKQANPFADAFFVRQRGRFGSNLEHISSWEKMTCYEEVLHRGRMLIVSLDQNYTDAGTPVQFFGQTLSCAKGTGVLHLRTKAPVFTSVYYMKEGQFHIDFNEVSLPTFQEINEEAINDICQYSIRPYEEFVRIYPDQWFSMFHRLWSKEREYYPVVNRSFKDLVDSLFHDTHA